MRVASPEEKIADEFAIKKMGTSKHIKSVLMKLNNLFKGIKYFPREKKLESILSVVKILFGVRKMIYWHPEFETRLGFLSRE